MTTAARLASASDRFAHLSSAVVGVPSLRLAAFAATLAAQSLAPSADNAEIAMSDVNAFAAAAERAGAPSVVAYLLGDMLDAVNLCRLAVLA